jgi:DNA-binding MarR family transcriptional regulator
MTDGPETDELDFLTFPQQAVAEAKRRLPDLDGDAMRIVLGLHRVTNALVYDLESTVHRPRGWSWAGFRLLFVLWISGPLEGRRVATLSGMSRAAVSNLVNTLARDGLVHRETSAEDARAVILSLTDSGRQQFDATFGEHNAREQQWSGLLSAPERRQLIRLLDKLTSGAHENWVSRRN